MASEYTIKQLAEKLAVTEKTVHNWKDHGLHGVTLRTTTVGTRHRITQQQYDEFQAEVDRRRRQKPAPPVSAAEKRRGYRQAQEVLRRMGVNVGTK